ncbi:hypothetical protein LCGC14_1148000 [marine sediment metagenome]|uniref:PD-(D/E)XK endonuclease-like domain-containing protein n=1 Tax=marine sediment metagenome TaxID=412755 RepID=A0A0F9Q202_9ZZZZ
MRFTRNPEREDEIIAQFKANMEDDERKEMFPSVSDLIYCLTKAYYKQRYFPDLTDRGTILQFYTGIVIEAAIYNVKGTSVQNPTKGKYEGIFYHTDHVAGPVLEEAKTTAMTMKNAPDNIPVYQRKQVLAYMKAEGLTQGRFIIYYKSGDYSTRTPDIAVWDILLNPDEVEENWAWMLERKQILEDFIARDKAPTAYHYRSELGERECEGCQFSSLCELEVQGLA